MFEETDRELPGPVRSEIKEKHAVVRSYHARPRRTWKDGGFKELVYLFRFVALAQVCARAFAFRYMPFTAEHRRFRSREPVPILVAIHREVAPYNRRNTADAEFLEHLLKLGNVLRAAFRGRVPAVRNDMNGDIREPRFSRGVQKTIKVLTVAMDASRRNEADDVEC